LSNLRRRADKIGSSWISVIEIGALVIKWATFARDHQ